MTRERPGRMGSDTKLERIQARREEMAIKVKRMREGASGKEEWSKLLGMANVSAYRRVDS